MENDNRSLMQYFSIILSALIIGYFLIITNPPKDLLQYKDNLVVTLPLQGNQITTHLGSISIFLGIYALICFLIGFITINILKPLYVKGRGWMATKASFGALALGLFSTTFVLALVLQPYYGGDLFSMSYVIGLAAFFTGLVLNFPTDARNLFPPLVLASWIIASLWTASTIEILSWTVSMVAIIIVFTVSYLVGRHLQSKSLT
jgi:hypothetical protein